jgi:translation initiation factor IF-2
MALLTVDDLARDLKVKNEDLLRELVTMGFDVDGPESRVETDDPAGLRETLVTALPQREVIEKRIKPTVIRRRIKKKSPPAAEALPKEEPAPPKDESIPEPSSTAEPAAEEVATKTKAAPKKPGRKTKKSQAAKIIEKAPVPEPEAAPEPEPVKREKPARKAAAKATAKKAAEATPAEAEAAPAEAAPAEAPEEVEAKPAEETPEQAKAAEEKPKKKKKKEKKIQPAQIIGRVELKKEPPREPASSPRGPASRPAPGRPPHGRPFGPGPVGVQFPPDEDKRKRKKKDRRGPGDSQDQPSANKGAVRRRKEVLLRRDLYDDRPRHGRLRPRGKKAAQRKTAITVPRASKRRIKIPEVITVADLSHKISVKSAEVIQHLMALGVTASMNEGIDFETASIVASEFGFESGSAETSEQTLLPDAISDSEENLEPRPPVITVMGHVDHGKTSLLDFIRSTHVTDSESGGITQHIGAYKVKLPKGEIVFLDTPGHEAFTAMRARGAQVTDFVILVVAADDGVMEQTREAINHARAAKVPVVVAINKIDKPEADVDKVTRELSEHDLIPEAWGGDTVFTQVSAKTGEGVDEFLEMILLHAEMMELKANPNKTASGTVVEARLDKGKGPVATILIREGTLKLGDPFVAGFHSGRVRAMLDHEGKPVKEATPATPVEVQGFSGVPDAGELFLVVTDEKIARQIGQHRQLKQKQQDAVPTGPLSLEDLLAKMKSDEVQELSIIIKGDVHGSVEALKEALLAISSDEVRVSVIHEGVGTVTESDVMLAGASDAVIIGFNVRPSPKTTQIAEEQNVEIRLYSVIYEAIEDTRKRAGSMLAPIEKETVVGRAEVRKTFSVSRVGTIAGCHVTWGKILRSNSVRLLRDDVPVYEGKIESLKRFKDDVKEVLEGYECGIVLENYKDIKVGDVVEAFVIEQEPAMVE